QNPSWPHFQVCGSTIVFAWGNRIIGVDPEQKKELWSLNVLGDVETTQQGSLASSQMMPHPQLPNRFQLLSPNGALETLGTVGPGSSQRVVAMIKDVGLIGLDPQTGERLWTRSGFSTNVELFG